MKKHYLLISLLALVLSSCGNQPINVSSATSIAPSISPTVEPTVNPTVEPTIIPTVEPTIEPTIIPTIEPTTEPTITPTKEPTITPTVEPTITPTIIPTVEPTITPTFVPTVEPTVTPSVEPSIEPIVELNPMNEPLINKQYYLNHIGDIYNTWKSYKGKGVTIAVIDKGFKPDHEDFTFSDGTSKVSDLSASFTYNGSKVTTSVGKDKVVNLGDSHGSFCAGVAAAGLNGKGVIGIAPEATLMLLKTDGKPKSICEAFKYAADNGARVVTISIGSYWNYDGDLAKDGSDLSTVFNEPVSYCRNKGTVVISAGGNGGLEDKPTEYTFPGASEGVIGCGGIAGNSTEDIWSGSSYNSSKKYQFCDVFAPADAMCGVCHYSGKDYDTGWNGTSFASPIVAGMAALYFEKNPNNSVKQFESDLYASCHKIGTTDHYGYGRVDVGYLLGTNTNENIDIKVSYSGSTLYCYAYNLIAGKENRAWPGVKMTKSGNYYQITLNPSSFDTLLFNNGGDSYKSVDIATSSFIYGNVYNLNNSYKDSVVNVRVGSYIAN